MSANNAEPLDAWRKAMLDRITLLCFDATLFQDVPVGRVNTMLGEIRAAIVKCKPDPPGMVK